MNTSAASTLTKEELLGRYVHDGKGSFIIAAWYTSPKKAREIKRAGCALVWPEWKWYWLEDLAVSGEDAAILPALGTEQRKKIRKSLAEFLIPFGSDKWVAQEVGYKDARSVRTLREAMGLEIWWERRTVPPEIEIEVVESWLDGESMLSISRRINFPRNLCEKIMKEMGRVPRNGTVPKNSPTRKRVIRNLKKKHGNKLTRRWR